MQQPSAAAAKQTAGNEGSTYFVSTVTVVSALGDAPEAVDIRRLYEVALFDDEPVPLQGGEALCETIQAVSVQLYSRLRTAGGEVERRRAFGNQVTVVFVVASSALGPKKVSTKVFSNGSVQLAGVRRIDQGPLVVAHLVDWFRRSMQRADEAATPPPAVPACQVALINANFDVGIHLRRDRLQQCVRDAYRTVCSYEPCVYPGVKIKYMWNEDARDAHGVCRCRSGPCAGRGDGRGDGLCRKVTISVFQSGKAMITGAKEMVQVEAAYRFLMDVVIAKHREALLLPPPPSLAPSKPTM